MFKKVLVAEDIDSINVSVIQVLEELGIMHIDHVKYCDDAFLKIRRGIADNEPYDLLICDLSFERDHRQTTINSGEEPIQQLRNIDAEMKIIVYSIEGKTFRVKSLIHKNNINAYVLKGRNSIDELKAAIHQIEQAEGVYLSSEIQHLVKEKNTFEIDNYDVTIIKQLAAGFTQDDMEARLKDLGITPNSKSTIEKRISKLKDYFRANNTVHLIAIAKDFGIV